MTEIEKVRALIGDPAGSNQQFEDSAIQAYLEIESGDLLLAAALALDALAAKAEVAPQEFSIGKYQQSDGRAQVRQFTTLADSYRERAYNTPAFAVAQENLSEFNALIMLRNSILKTLP